MAPFAQKRVLAHQREEDRPAPTTGRPSEYKPEYCKAVQDYMAKGFSLTAFAGSIRMSKDAVYDWMSVHRDFSHAVARGKAARVAALEDKMLKARYGAQASTSIFALKNADPHEWKDQRSVTHDHNITLQTMSDEQLLAIAQGHSSAPMIDVTPGKKTK